MKKMFLTKISFTIKATVVFLLMQSFFLWASHPINDLDDSLIITQRVPRNLYITDLDQEALNLGNAVKTHIRDQRLSTQGAIDYRKNLGILPLTHLFLQEPTSLKALKIYEMYRDNGALDETALMRGVFFILFNTERGYAPFSGLENGEIVSFIQRLLREHDVMGVVSELTASAAA